MAPRSASRAPLARARTRARGDVALDRDESRRRAARGARAGAAVTALDAIVRARADFGARTLASIARASV